MATTTLGAGEVFDSNIHALAAIDRTKMAQRTEAKVVVPLADWRVWDAPSEPLPGDGTVEAAVETASYYWDPTSADDTFFVAVRAYRVVGVTARIEVAGTDGGAVTAAIKKAASGTDIASGTALHTSTIDLKGTVNTNQSLTLSATSTDLDIAAGTAIGIDFTGTLTSARGCVTVLLAPAASPDDLRHALGAFGAAPCYLSTGDVKAAGATVKYARAVVPVPLDFEGNTQTIKVRLCAGMKTTIADGSATVDVEAYRVKRDGTYDGADLVLTNATSFNSLTKADYDFDLTNSTLLPGDSIDVRVKVSVTDTATVTAVIGAIYDTLLLVDIR